MCIMGGRGSLGLLPYQDKTKMAGDFGLVSLVVWEKMETPSRWAADEEDEDDV